MFVPPTEIDGERAVLVPPYGLAGYTTYLHPGFAHQAGHPHGHRHPAHDGLDDAMPMDHLRPDVDPVEREHQRSTTHALLMRDQVGTDAGGGAACGRGCRSTRPQRVRRQGGDLGTGDEEPVTGGRRARADAGMGTSARRRAADGAWCAACDGRRAQSRPPHGCLLEAADGVLDERVDLDRLVAARAHADCRDRGA